MISSVVFEGSVGDTCDVLYCPAGVNRRLPSGVNVSRLKKDVKVSLAYRLAFLIPRVLMLGDAASSGLTAGSGKDDAAGDADRRNDGEEPNDDRRLCDTGGGSIGKFEASGVPGVEGVGEVIAAELVGAGLLVGSGAGLLEGIRLAGKSIFKNFPCEVSVNWPSFVLRL